MADVGLITSIIRNIMMATGNANDARAEQSIKSLKELCDGPKSIAEQAKMGIFGYPFLISSNVSSIEIITSLMKSIEIELAQMVQIKMGLAPCADETKNVQIQRTLSTYHTRANDYTWESEYNSDIELKSLNDMYIFEKMSHGTISMEARRVHGNNAAGHPPRNQNTGGQQQNQDIDDDATQNQDSEDSRPRRNDRSSREEPPVPPKKPPISYKHIETAYASRYNMTVIEMTFRLSDDVKTNCTFPIGIRAIAHPLPADELQYIIGSYTNHQAVSPLIKLLKWTSGEVKAAQLLFGFDDIINDINFEKRIGTSNSWLKILRSRAHNRKVNQLTRVLGPLINNKISITNTHDILPDCTFVLSMQDVDEIELKTGINLYTDPSKASRFLDEAMGLCICIVDDIYSVIHILYQSYKQYNSVPYKTLKDKIKSENDLTKVFTEMMKKMF